MKFKFYKAKEIVVYADNKPGTLHAVATSLGESGVNIDSISALAKDENTAVFRLLTNDFETARKALERTPGVRSVSAEDVIIVELENKPGELAKLTQRLLSKGVDLEALYIVKADSTTEVAIRGASQEKLEEALKES